MAMTAAMLAVGIGLSFLSAFLFRPKPPKQRFGRDTKPTTLAERGSYIPYLMGVKRIGNVFGWAGRRELVQKKSRGGGKGGGRKTVTEQTYFESGVHYLCIGPAHALTRIWANGKVIYNQRITRDDTPNGTEVIVFQDKSTKESFKIYWGDETDTANEHPIDIDMSAGDAFGVSSRWPAICRVFWVKKKLGNAPTWPQMDYEVEVRPKTGLLANSIHWLVEQQGDGDRGANPAHAIMHLLTEEWPRGLGIDSADIATDLLEDVGAIAENEHLPISFVVTDGTSATKILAEIMQDVGLTLVQTEGKLAFKALREIEDPPTLDDDTICPPQPERSVVIGDKPASKANFLFEDSQIDYKDRTFTLDDDSEIRVKDKSIGMPTVNAMSVAARVADRRQVEELSNVRQVRWIGKRGARLLGPGQVFIRDGVRYRITSVDKDSIKPDVVLNTVIDIYNDSFSGYQPILPGPPIQVKDVVPDSRVAIFEPTFDFTDGEKLVSVMRVAGNDQIVTATVNMSLDGVSYLPSGEQKIPATFGTLAEDIEETDPKIQENGPTVQFDDVSDILDLSANEQEWKLGVQQLVINNEVFYLRNIEFVSGTLYRLKGLIRARRGTDEDKHFSDSGVWIYRQDDQKLLASELIALNATLFVKTQPETEDEIIDLADVTAVSKLLTGRWFAPYNPDNFRVENPNVERFNRFTTGQDIVTKWNNRVRDGDGTAAGESLSGIAVVTSNAMDGVLRLQLADEFFVDKGDPIDVSSGETHTITNAELVSIFGSEPSAFKIRYRQFDGAFFAPEKIIDVIRI